MMTRKDYIAVSNILKDRKASIPEDAYIGLVNDVANYMSSDNPRFEKSRFIEACGLKLSFKRSKVPLF